MATFDFDGLELPAWYPDYSTDVCFAADCGLTMQTKHVIRRAVKIAFEYMQSDKPQAIDFGFCEQCSDEAEGEYTYEHPQFAGDIESQHVLCYLLEHFNVAH